MAQPTSSSSSCQVSGSTHHSQSSSDSERMQRAMEYLGLSEDESLGSESSSASLSILVLRKSLRTNSITSTTSSFASRMQLAAARTENRDPLRVIGLGSCGTVLEIPGTQLAYKKGSDPKSMWNDFNLTNIVHNAFRDTHQLLRSPFPQLDLPTTPLCHEFYPVDDQEFWNASLLGRLPSNHRTQQPCFVVDHILPLPQVTREALILQYFDEDEEIQEEAKDDVENKDCLARIYLGERETIEQQNAGYSTLRNFPLRLNMIEDIGLDASQLASEMAVGLAVLHWKAHVDAMDVEFVLGTSATEEDQMIPRGYHDTLKQPHRVPKPNFQRRRTRMWILDFDKATQFKPDVAEVRSKLVHAHRGNDPYFPRPTADDMDLWNIFKAAYLRASELILRDDVWCLESQLEGYLALPRAFVEELERLGKEDENWDPESYVQFG